MEKYYNKITRKMTEHPYRFKTKDEFDNDFKVGWNNVNTSEFIGWHSPDMDCLFGVDFKMDYEKDYLVGAEAYFLKNDGNGRCWYIDRSFLVKNEKQIDYNKPTKLVYEKSNIELEKKICIIYKCESIEKVGELKKYLKGKVYTDVSNNYDEYMLITRDIVCSFKSSSINPVSEIIKLWEADGYKIVMCKTIEEVKRIFKFDSKTAYNKPTKLVYEKKILSFKNFNDK